MQTVHTGSFKNLIMLLKSIIKPEKEYCNHRMPSD